MTMTGHNTRSVFDRYHIVSPGDLTDAAQRLDAAAEAVAGKVSGKVSRPEASAPSLTARK